MIAANPLSICLLDVRRFFPHDRDKGKGKGKCKGKGKGEGKSKGKGTGGEIPEHAVTGDMAECQKDAISNNVETKIVIDHFAS